MSYIAKQAENEKFVLKIVQDDDASNPRKEFDNAGTMLCWHNRYELGDEHSYREPRDFLEEFVVEHTDIDEEEIEDMQDSDLYDIVEKHAVVLPLFLYDHSGITMNTTGFSCPWDSGQVGIILMTHSEIEKEFGSLDIARAEEYLKGEVETYDQYLTGDVYGYELIEKDEEDGEELDTIESCWGFYGLGYIVEELKGHLGDEYKELIEKLA